MGEERRVGGDDDDDRALSVVVLIAAVAAPRWCGVTPWTGRADRRIVRRDARQQIADLLAHGHTGHAQLASRAAVALNEHAHRVAALPRVELSRRRADAALEAVADHPRSPADVS